jgi:putative component of membrane protein insertase Oxa1/YidC/SpoIIIJ protein YidD
MIFPLLLGSCTSGVVNLKHEVHDSNNLLAVLIRIHEGPLDHLNAVRRGECPMYPSCSAYAKEANLKHGMLIGWIMTMDRLIRCGRDEIDHSQESMVGGKVKFYDPVKGNDFWWMRRDLKLEPGLITGFIGVGQEF